MKKVTKSTVKKITAVSSKNINHMILTVSQISEKNPCLSA
jgi:hypothetical protein